MKRIFSNLFGQRHRRQYEDYLVSDETMMSKLKTALSDCEQEKTHEQNKIDEYKEHAKDLIFGIFHVPEMFWYEELNCYEKIKEDEQNRSVDPKIIKKTDELIENYINRIKRCESKIDICHQLTEEFESLLIKLEQTKLQIQKAELEEKQNILINKHIEYINKENNLQYEPGKLPVTDGQLEHLKEELHKIEVEFRIQQNVKVYMQKMETDLNHRNTDFELSSLKDIIENLKRTGN